jgi:hypothetical protein
MMCCSVLPGAWCGVTARQDLVRLNASRRRYAAVLAALPEQTSRRADLTTSIRRRT